MYQCLSGLSAEEVIASISSISSVAYSNIPTPDDDFFPDDITLQSYALSQRFARILIIKINFESSYYICANKKWHLEVEIL